MPQLRFDVNLPIDCFIGIISRQNQVILNIWILFINIQNVTDWLIEKYNFLIGCDENAIILHLNETLEQFQ